MKKIEKILLIFIIISLTSFSITDDFIIKRIKEKFDLYSNTFPIKKIFVHTDKENYVVGENIWFKTYLVENKKNKLDTTCTNIYVELINSDNEIEQIKLLKLKNGTSNGDFYLPDSLATGDYQIRSYVELMKNFSKEYFFTKAVYIHNQQIHEISRTNYKKTKKIKRKKKYFDVSFFPEGEGLIPGISAQIIFKAENYEHNGIKIHGQIIDKSKKVIAEIETNKYGYGKFSFTPEADNKYTAIVYNEKNNKKKFVLPECKKTGYVLNINSKNDGLININIKSNIRKTNDEQFKTIYLLAHCRGKIYYSYSKILENNESSVSINKNIFPSGIIHFTLFDGRGKPQNKRMLYIDHKDNFKINISTKQNKNKTEVSIQTKDFTGKNIPANLSVSIVNINEKQTNTNITNYILFSSELEDKINSHIFSETNTNTQKDVIDMFLISKTWDKYNWKNILSNKIDSPLYKIKKGITISGNITKQYLRLPSENTGVTLTILNEYNDYLNTKTNKKGEFSFNNLFYPDTLHVLLEATSLRGKDNVLVYANTYDTIPPDFNPIYDITSLEYSREHIKNEPVKIRKTNSTSLHRHADQIIYFDEINIDGYSSVADVIANRVPGLEVTGNTARIRGFTSINQSSEPLCLIDDIPVNFGAIANMSPENVERVEIIKSSANATIYGSRGANGIIAVYTKKGHNIISGWLKLSLHGFYIPKPFFYNEQNLKYPENNFPTIFWKPEIITNQTGQAKFTFTLPENTNSYKIIIQGISENGKTGYLEISSK